jgi:hypothetical protein
MLADESAVASAEQEEGGQAKLDAEEDARSLHDGSL